MRGTSCHYMFKASAKMKIPWLRELEAEESVLNSSERTLVEEVYSATEKEIQSRGAIEVEGEASSHQVSVVEKNLRLIVHRLKRSQEAKQRFVEEYPHWEKVRTHNIEALEDIGNSLNSTRKNCNISRLVGNCTSLVGGGMCIASAVLTPFTMGLTAPLAVAGGSVTFLGSAASVGTTVAEIAKLRNKLQEANDILRRDQESFEVLKQWLTHASELSDTLESLLDIEEDDRMEGILLIIRQFAEVIFSARNKADKAEMVNMLVKSALPKIPAELIRSTLTANLVSLLLVITLLHKRNRAVFENASKTLKVISNVVSLVDFSVDAFQTASNVIKSDIALTANVSKTVVKGAVALFGMTLDMASIVLTSIDVHKGSLSDEGLKILEATQKLRDECNILGKVYKELHIN